MQEIGSQEFHKGLVKKYLFSTALTREPVGNNALLFKRPIEVAVGMKNRRSISQGSEKDF